SSAMQTAIQAANDAGIMFVAAAGNSGTNNDVTAQYPANYNPPNVISVAASDQNDQLASFSCYGAATVDLAAPGVSIYSTVPNNRYAYYSGTSMATPMVSGVAALAWAYKPTATVADIRNAILQGVDKISSLSGKVASGGRLDAYNTLKLLGAGAAPSLPVLASLLVNPASTVTKGASVTLVAQAAASSAGVSAVYYYQDSNGNGTFDVADACIGYVNTVVNGTAQFAVNTGGMTPGTSRYFARATDKNGQLSAALSTTLTILAPDDYGNNPASAAAIAVGSTTSGSIETGGDQDWFKFQAVAGKKYLISTTLAGLTDSVLTLYAGNGTTQLAYNDDIASNNPASRIQWTAPASGTYFIKTTAYDTHQTGGYKLSLTLQNSPPVLQTISDQILSSKAGGIIVPLSVSDPDGDHLALSATAYTVDAKTQAHVSVPGAKAALTLSGNQLRITRDANYTGVFYVDVTASDGTNAVLKSFKVTATNSTQQWLVPSSASSLSLGENLSQGATLARPATAAMPPALEAIPQVASGNVFSQALSNYVIYQGMQSKSLSLLHADISAQAVEFAFHENYFQGESWMPENMDFFRNVSGNLVGGGDQILEERMDLVSRNTPEITGENAVALSNVPAAGFSKGIEAVLESWDNPTSRTGSFEEYFALLGMQE
ncbi:MAG: S8 family serine peptidase, partial [Thermoguttaceae bacterium]